MELVEERQPKSFSVNKFIHFLCFNCDFVKSFCFKSCLSSYLEILLLLRLPRGDEEKNQEAYEIIFETLLKQTNEMAELLNTNDDSLQK